MERTLVVIKPDALQRRLVGRVIQRFEDKGLKIVALKMMWVGRELGERLYGPHQGKVFYEPLLRFIASAPVVVLVVEAPDAIRTVRQLMGPTFGAEAEPGTIRGDLAISNRFNLVHGSDSAESAAGEIALFFRPEEILDYQLTDARWVSELLVDEK